MLKYFDFDDKPIVSSAVEAGSTFATITPSGSDFQCVKKKLFAALTKIPVNAFYIFPVTTPSNGKNIVAGFAWLKLKSIVLGKVDDSINLSVEVGDSMPLRNCAAGGGIRSTPPSEDVWIPEPVNPFVGRGFDFSSRAPMPYNYRGVALAPALAPQS